MIKAESSLATVNMLHLNFFKGKKLKKKKGKKFNYAL